MTFCENCNCHLGGTNNDIIKHLEEKHGIHVRLGEDSHLAYCNDCHKYLGKTKSKITGDSNNMQCFVNQRQALEQHLNKAHAVDMHEGSMGL